MTTSKFDLHTIEYSVQGWDSIMTTDMNQIDDRVQTRILGTLGETVAAYDPLYLNSDGKWYKAQADGTKQPCRGIAVEGGILDGVIRIHREGEITNAGWSWGYKGRAIYLSPVVGEGMSQKKKGANAQILGYAKEATKMVFEPEPWDPSPLTTTSSTTTTMTAP